MITGTLKQKINAIWQDFYNANMAQTSDIVNQLTMLMFIKMLDDKQNEIEAQARIIGVIPQDVTFKEGEYINYIERNGKRDLLHGKSLCWQKDEHDLCGRRNPHRPG